MTSRGIQTTSLSSQNRKVMGGDGEKTKRNSCKGKCQEKNSCQEEDKEKNFMQKESPIVTFI